MVQREPEAGLETSGSLSKPNLAKEAFDSDRIEVQMAEAAAQRELQEKRTETHIQKMASERMTNDKSVSTSYFAAIRNSLRRLLNTVLDTIAHFVVFIVVAHGSWLSFIVLSTAVLATVFYARFDNGSMAAKLDWQFVSFALVFPVTFFLAETWRRRERALSKMAGIKSLSFWIYLAHRDWLHQEKLPQGHLVKVQTVLVRMLCDLHGYITLRRLTTRDLYFAVGKHKRFAEFEAKRSAWRREMYTQMKLLSRLCEDLKDAGLPTNEASRINQYHSLFLRDLEEVMNIKDYRTPQGIRSFSRVYVILIWALFGSYYAWVARETGSLAFAICLAGTASLALVGLIKVSMTMEDPFESIGVDDVRTSRDLAEVILAIRDDSLEDSLALLRDESLLPNGSQMPQSPSKGASSLFPVLKVRPRLSAE